MVDTKLDELVEEFKGIAKKLINYLEANYEVDCYSMEYYKDDNLLKVQAGIYDLLPGFKMSSSPLDDKPNEALVRFKDEEERIIIWDIWQITK